MIDSESAAGELTGRVSVVLPCLDEAAALPGVLSAMPSRWRVVVVDNGSTDQTAEVARRGGARVVNEPRRGYGAAVHTGIEAADDGVVVVLDGDGSLDPAELLGAVALVDSGRADLVCGRRRPVQRRVWPWHARVGNLVLAAMIRRGTGVPLHDIAPVRVATRDGFLGLGVADRRCGYPLETLLAAADRGWRIVEQDVSYRRRAAGSRSKISGTVRGTWRVGRDFAAVLLQHRSRRLRPVSTAEPVG